MGLFDLFKGKPSINKIYPYLIPHGYLDAGVKQEEIVRSLGHYIFVCLVYDLNGAVRNVTVEDLAMWNLSRDQAYQKALENLSLLMEIQVIKMQVFPEGPMNKPFILVGGHWLAAAAILEPNLHTSSRILNTEDLYVSIPHRDAMLIFPQGDRPYRDAMRVMIKEKEDWGPKPLTEKLFVLSNKGVVALEE